MRLFPLITAGMAGASMAVQGALNAVLGKKVGEFEAAFIVHVIGTLLLGIMLALGVSSGDLRNIRLAPWFSFLGGPLSAIIVWGVISSVSKVGVTSATTAVVTLQIFTALILDFIGLTGRKIPLDFTRILGAVIFIIGAYLLLRKAS